MSAVRALLSAALMFAALPCAFAEGEAEAGRFRIRFGGANGPELDWVIGLFEKADAELTPLFGEGAPAVVHVVLSRSEREWEVDVGPDSSRAAGVVDEKNVVFVALPASFRHVAHLPFTIKHEAIHAMLGPGFNDTAPHWLVEGVATYYSGEKRVPSPFVFDDEDDVARALRGKNAMRRSAAYSASASRVELLVQDCGGPAVVAWLNALRTDPNAVLGGAEAPCRSRGLPKER
jgi:hypothetical protein